MTVYVMSEASLPSVLLWCGPLETEHSFEARPAADLPVDALLGRLAEDLPVADRSVDVVISNGVLNLAVDKERAFAEVYRVLKPGGRLQLADVAVARELSLGARSDVDLWAA